jgi:hypothetical protein
MSITPQALTPALMTVACLTPIMFEQGDEVMARSRMLHFWMTITEVNPSNGFCMCNFGFSGRFAGNFHYSELRFYSGEEHDLITS